MTKRDFFIVLIKVFGLFSLVTSIFSVLPGNIAFALMDLDTYSILWISISLILLVGLFVVLIFKADKVVQFLKLDKGFDEERIDFGNLKSTDIIKISVFIIGGLLILYSIPEFLSHSLFAFKASNMGYAYSSQKKFDWAVSGLNLIIGFLLLINYERIARKLGNEKA